MWKNIDNCLQISLKFKDFKTAWAFMNDVAFQSETMNHHPNWENSYNLVSVKLYTHDAKNTVTEKDHQLAKAIDEILKNYQFQVL